MSLDSEIATDSIDTDVVNTSKCLTSRQLHCPKLIITPLVLGNCFVSDTHVPNLEYKGERAGLDLLVI